MPTEAFAISKTEKVDGHFQRYYNEFRHGPVQVMSIDEPNTGRPDDQFKDEIAFSGIIGRSPALKFVLAEVERVAPTDSTVLVLGETGTGKELIARAIHNLSPRRRSPFLKVNCAAIPFDLLESELFGHEKGAFTGAIAQKIGRFEMADTGTLFLDEIGDLPLVLQPKLLRVLQEQEFERVGGSRTHHIDVRLVAATHRDLAGMVARKEFRSDLYYRLNVFPVVLPSLRERRQDIPQLAGHFVEVFARRMGKRIDHIPPEILDIFTSYPWPGNVRELQNLIERAVIRSDNGVLPNPLLASQESPIQVTAAARTFNDSQRAVILQALRAARGMIGGPRGAAARLGLKRTTLISKMKRLGIYRPRRQGDVSEFDEESEKDALFKSQASDDGFVTGNDVSGPLFD
ncbi:MAG: Fis family transcriptional regulator [Acidobacteria bacterium]|nr:MAG: Fis family transcriptional regulator [Acidobacteriota bacterium]